jgi:predicted enzyme related to lactoylglutathione lyase
MFSKLNHVAIVSEDYAGEAQFYQAVFGMKTSKNALLGTAITVGDGYVGLNINPRYAGRPAHLDHFGIEVEDVERVFDRMQKKYPSAKWLKRPGNRPFAGISANDTDGNIFDISQRDMANRTNMYVDNAKVEEGNCYITHFAIRTLNPDAVAEFYQDVFELTPRNKDSGDPNHYLTDGRVTMVIRPWQLKDYAGTSIYPAGMEHIGFTVKNYAEFRAHAESVLAKNPLLAPLAAGSGTEAETRIKLTRSDCAVFRNYWTDPDGIVISVGET